MRDDTLDDVLQRIRSERTKERTDGIAELKTLLAQSRQLASLGNLSDKAHHKILETLFYVAQLDSSNYAIANKTTTKNNLRSRLNACASVIRFVVESGVLKLRLKTVKAIADHVTQTLPKADDGYCEPLLTDYLKTLRTLLEHPSHVEHLSKSDWLGLIDFFIQCIQDLNSSIQESASVQGVFSTDSRYESRASTPRSSLKSNLTRQHSSRFSRLKPVADDILGCVHHLCAASNSPKSDRNPDSNRNSYLISSLLAFLQLSANAGSAQQNAFEAMLHVLDLTSIGDVDLTTRTYTRLLPIIARSWSSKPSSYRDLLTVHLLRSTVFVHKCLQEKGAEETYSELNELMVATRSEYCKRPERERLQVDDLEYHSHIQFCTATRPLCTKSFAVRYGAGKAEQSWALLHTHAAYTVALDTMSTRSSNIVSSPITRSSKRQRLDNAMEELSRLLVSGQGEERLYASQVIALILDIHAIGFARLTDLVELLLMRLSDPNALVISWAMLALTSATTQQAAKANELSDFWAKAWHNVARLITSPANCRAACVFLGKAIVSGVVALGRIDNTASNIITSLDLSGPAYLNDSSASFLSVLMSSNYGGTTTLNSAVSQRVLRWAFARWKPSNTLNKAHVLRNAITCPVLPLVEMIFLCHGLTFSCIDPAPPINLGRVSQEHLKLLGMSHLLQYVLLPLVVDKKHQPGPKTPSSRNSRVSLSTSQAAACHGITLDLIMLEASAILETSLAEDSDAPSPPSADTITVLVSYLLVANIVCSFPMEQTLRRNSSILQTVAEISKRVRTSMLAQKGMPNGLEGLLRPFDPWRGNLDLVSNEIDILAQGLLRTTGDFNFTFWNDLRQRRHRENVTVNDEMEIDDGVDSQGSRPSGHTKIATISHSEHVASTDARAFQATNTAMISYCSIVYQAQRTNGESSSNAITSIMEHFLSLDPQELLSAKAFLKELMYPDSKLSAQDVAACLEYIAQELLQSYDYERCEVSLGLCLDIMNYHSQVWTDPVMTEVAHLGSNMYEWFITVALHRGISSPYVYTCMSSMLQHVIKIRPNYAHELSLESARTSLFHVLKDGNLLVKHRVGESISEIFGLFVLKEHENILEDVIQILPQEGDWNEGIAVRLYILAHLGAAWPTLLRRSVYAIFETPQHVPEATKHAKYCLGYIATSLQLSSAKELFRLFAPQVIYTWLDTEQQTITSMPFSIFGYETIEALLKDIKDEAVGQIIMRGKDDGLTEVATLLEVTYEQLIIDGFSKATAYSVSRDISMPPSTNPNVPGAETRLRAMVGKEAYASLVVEHFPEILSILYRRIDQESHLLKGFERHSFFQDAGVTYERMKGISASEESVPTNQQPSFKAGYLGDIMKHLCRRTTYDIETLWTPSLYVYVMRQLLNDLHRALGSLHACSVLRRARVLIATAGSVALDNYALEMTLHALRPFLADVHCAEDAIGMMQYMIQAGSAYLQRAPSFMLGHAVLTLPPVKGFLGSTQDSTTQESHFRSTLSKASAFHLWFAELLRQYRSSELTEPTEQTFGRMVNAACNVQGNGNARKGTYESDLLIEILSDQATGQRLLSATSRKSILASLCTSFEHPPPTHEDCLESKYSILNYAPLLWSICRQLDCSENFLLWVGRSLGRAYAMTGSTSRCFHDDFPNLPTPVSTMASPALESISTTMRTLSDLLGDGSSTANGAAESTLRSILALANERGEALDYEQHLPASLVEGLRWRQYSPPRSQAGRIASPTLRDTMCIEKIVPHQAWLVDISSALTTSLPDHPLVSNLLGILGAVTAVAETLFPCILHLTLLEDVKKRRELQPVLSEGFHHLLQNGDSRHIQQLRVLLRALVYLRKQPLPDETAKADRNQWLEIDYMIAADAAARCSMFEAALLFLETSFSEAARASRRSSSLRLDQPVEALTKIYTSIDEPDSFYGVLQPSSLASMKTRLEYEHAGFKSLSFTSAFLDSDIRLGRAEDRTSVQNMVQTLDNLSLHGISRTLLSDTNNEISIDAIMRNARKLEQWDVSVPPTQMSSAGSLFRTFQGLNDASNRRQVMSAVDVGILSTIKRLSFSRTSETMRGNLCALVTFAEVDEIFSPGESNTLHRAWVEISSRDEWMHSESFEHVKEILSCRETLTSTISKRPQLQSLLRTSRRDALDVQVQALLTSSRLSRSYEALQHALATTTFLNHLIDPCLEIGVSIEAAASYESAQVLWQQGEMSSSIRILQELRDRSSHKSQLHLAPAPELLATLGHQVAEARLEKPDEIISHYLAPAIKELHGTTTGLTAGKVYHEFASFCDQQLQNPDALEDFQRLKKLRARKEAEVQDLDKMIKATASQSKERDNLKSYRTKAKQWFDLDDREYQRLRGTRETFLRQSLENYLLCLRAGEEYNNDALRFSALWLENWSNEIADQAVSKYIRQVATRKFAPLMNQWSSRLLSDGSHFQELLSTIVTRICIEHPYHGMYQIFASSKTKGGKDDVALSRHRAATAVTEKLKADPKSSTAWRAIHNTNIGFVRFATDRLDDSRIKPGSKIALRKSATGQRLESDTLNAHQRVPPPTLRTPLRADCDYSKVPLIARFSPEFTVASGISMPKIVTAVGTDGHKYKQLFKGGNDDLRQDSIMEQVFDQVSSLLRSQRITRQRKLGIRTYKVLPLTATSGIIEFVPNTMPLHDYLMPSHNRHFPKDMKPNICRKHIADAQSRSSDHRVRIFKHVIDHFHPVLRYFFTERFDDPETWFQRRTAYTRSTAAISILGHVLGLGDRHGHNILLDEHTGEVVHIDLGIAFEQGRVLPVPEVVPFRLTRDLVDGMGITGTEGVFRRCCEFTLEALRKEVYTIMTILDVLRYDPLYSWSLSPLRLKKMQEAQTEVPNVGGGQQQATAGGGGAAAAAVAATAGGNGNGNGDGNGNGGQGGEIGGGGAPPPPPQDGGGFVTKEEEPGEADRALMVVKKKLSKSLSVEATVNELIGQATSVENLALLFCGWAAYA